MSAFYDPLIPGNIEKRDAEIQRVFRELGEQEVSLRADGGGKVTCIHGTGENFWCEVCTKTPPHGEEAVTAPFARVEPLELVTEVGHAPYFKLLAAGIVLNEGFSDEELQEMADRLNAAVAAREKGLVEALKEIKSLSKEMPHHIYEIAEKALEGRE